MNSDFEICYEDLPTGGAMIVLTNLATSLISLKTSPTFSLMNFVVHVHFAAIRLLSYVINTEDTEWA
ncbi:MAG: hypothetical protein R2750_00920 [Bacteroidales bacterium]